MKNCWKVIAVIALLLLGTAGNTPAQTNIGDVTPSTSDRIGQVVVPDSSPTVDSAALNTVRPLLPERRDLPPEVKARIDNFKHHARAYLERQEALKRQLFGANDLQRARIREQLRSLRERWLEHTQEMRQEFRDRQKEMLSKLRDHSEVIDSARESARDQLRDQQEEIRERRGDE